MLNSIAIQHYYSSHCQCRVFCLLFWVVKGSHKGGLERCHLPTGGSRVDWDPQPPQDPPTKVNNEEQPTWANLPQMKMSFGLCGLGHRGMPYFSFVANGRRICYPTCVYRGGDLAGIFRCGIFCVSNLFKISHTIFRLLDKINPLRNLAKFLVQQLPEHLETGYSGNGGWVVWSCTMRELI